MKQNEKYKNLLRMYKVKLNILGMEPLDRELLMLCDNVIILLNNKKIENDKILKKQIKTLEKMVYKLKNSVEDKNELKLKKGKKKKNK